MIIPAIIKILKNSKSSDQINKKLEIPLHIKKIHINRKNQQKILVNRDG